MPTFDHLFVLGRPASGKSEFLDFMTKLSDAERAQKFHIGKMTVLDDFVWLWEKFEEDDLWEKVKGTRLHSKRAGNGYVLGSAELFDFLIDKLDREVARSYLTKEGYYEENTLLVEFSRGGEKPYGPALERFRPEIFERTAILYVAVSGEESMRRNEARYQEKLKHSVLCHKCPDEDMERFYRDDDWLQLTEGREEGLIPIGELKVPFVTMPNEPESTDPKVLGPRYGEALRQLWKLRATLDESRAA